MRGAAILVIVLTGCGATLGESTDTGDAPVGVDAADAPPDVTTLGPWGTPTKIGIAADPAAAEDDGSLSHSGLELVFAVVNPNDSNRKDLFYTSRPDLQSNFGIATKLPFSTDGTSEETPRFSEDDLTLFFAKTNGTNGLDVHRVTRPTAGSTNWGTPSLVDGVNGTGTDKWFMPCSVSNDYLMILGSDVAEGTLGGGLPTVVAELSTADGETGTFLTKDCLTAYFASTRGDGTNRIYTSTRTAIGQPWSTPAVVTDFQGLGGAQQDPFISDDDRIFVFVSNVDGTNDIYISTR